MEQLGSHWADFREILHLSIFKKYVEELVFKIWLTVPRFKEGLKELLDWLAPVAK